MDRRNMAAAEVSLKMEVTIYLEPVEMDSRNMAVAEFSLKMEVTIHL
jgi:hypothetical protein